MAIVGTFTSHLTHFFFFFFFILSPSLFRLALSVDEAASLIALMDQLQNKEPLQSSWIKGTNPCDKKKSWVGIVCNDGGSVYEIRLPDLGLSGNFDALYIKDLHNLRLVSLSNNSFSGVIPDFHLLGALKTILINDNGFSGEIQPFVFWKMESLKRIDLSSNNFSGKIPEEFSKMPNLRDLQLQHNQFSGPVPLFPQKSIVRLDLSHNKLQGEIPEGMLKFGKDAFTENPELCSPALGMSCNQKTSQDGNAQQGEGKGYTKWIILAIVVALLLMTLLFKAKRKYDHFYVLEKESFDDDDVMDVPVSNSHIRSLSSKSRDQDRDQDDSVRSSRKGSQSGKSVSELVIINDEKGTFGLTDLMKASAEVLGNGGLGSAFKAAMSNDVSVVVKRLRDANKLSREAFETEMRRLGSLRHRNILPLLAYHYRREEKLFVSEYVPKGSLLYLLHGDRGNSHGEMNWPTRLKIIKGVAQGMGFLHSEFASYELPHGNLKSSNILLSSDYEPLLTDYAFYPLINNSNTTQSLFSFKSPEAILYQRVTPKTDVYCLGIIILEVLTGKFPSQYMNNQKGGTDVVQWAKSAIYERKELELIDPEIASATNSLGQMGKLLYIGAACTESDLSRRIDMEEAIRRIEEIHV